MVNTLRHSTIHLDLDTQEKLQELLARTISHAKRLGKSVLVSFQAELSVPRYWLYHIMDGEKTSVRMFWADEQDTPYVGVDVVRRVTADGEERFGAVRDAMRHVRDEFLDASLPVPRWYGGFSFSPQSCDGVWNDWPQAMFFLPKFQFHGHPDSERVECMMTLEVDVDTDVRQMLLTVEEDLQRLSTVSWPIGATKPRKPQLLTQQEWESEVERTADDIRNGRFEKVVLARMAVHRTEDAVSLGSTLHSLRTQYPEGFVFALCVGEASFVGASPERLVRSDGGHVLIDCLAGTAPRGGTVVEDELIGSELIESKKNREEHAVVVQWIRDQVRPLVTNVAIAEEPRLKKLKNVQHLFTPLVATLKNGVGLIDVVRELHPTPAVAGVPREDALRVIQAREGFSRGWYAAPIGWVDFENNGDFSVALRSALIQGNQAFLFAGAGIMGDSEPSAEFEETELKMRPMKSVLGIERQGRA